MLKYEQTRTCSWRWMHNRVNGSLSNLNSQVLEDTVSRVHAAGGIANGFLADLENISTMVADVRAMIGDLPRDCSFHGSHGSMGHFDRSTVCHFAYVISRSSAEATAQFMRLAYPLGAPDVRHPATV
jgi:hypothetical protein